MGHVQGLAHETDYYNIVMYPYDSAYIEFGVYTPQADDQNGIIAIYG